MVSIGCVVSGPPEHGKARQTPPILVADLAVPSPYEVLSVEQGDAVELTVPLRSEDVGESLIARLYMDYPIAQPPLLQDAENVKAGVLEDGDRAITMDWNVPPGDGCRTLTLQVTHASNQDVLDPDDIGSITWWAQVGSADANLQDCPKVTGGTN